LIKFESVMAFI